MTFTQDRTRWDFDVMLPSVNRRVQRTSVPKGFLTKAVGVDGRYPGTSRQMPGMIPLRRVQFGADDFITVIDFKRFTIEKRVNDGTVDDPDWVPYKVEGFWIRGTTGATISEVSLLEFYDTKTGAWTEETLENVAGCNSGVANIATFGRYLYYARDGQTPKVFYWDDDAATFQLKTMGPGTPIPREKACTTGALIKGGVLKEGRILIAYRYANLDRHQFSAMSDSIEVDLPYANERLIAGTCELEMDVSGGNIYKGGQPDTDGGGTATWITGQSSVATGGKVPLSGTATWITAGIGINEDADNRFDGPPRGDLWRVKAGGPIDSEFNTIQIFRSISVDIAGGVYNAGMLWLEHEFDMPTAIASSEGEDANGCWDRGEGTWSRWVGNDGEDPDYDEAPNDEVLVSVPEARYDPRRDVVGAPPKSGSIAVFENVTFMGERGEDVGESVNDIRWSPTHKREMENFPDIENNRFSPNKPEADVSGFVHVGNILVGLSDAQLYRITRSGDGVLILPVLQGAGVSDHHAAIELASALIYQSPLGLGIVDSRTMNFQDVTAVNLKLIQDWAGTLSNVRMCIDSVLGALIAMNNNNDEAILIWTKNNAVTEGEDFAFAECTQGSIPNGSDDFQRGFFITDTGLIVYPDADESNSVHTMLGLTGTVNGTVTATAGSNFTDSGAAFDSDPVDAVVHFFDTATPPNEHTAKVTARVSGTELTVDSLPGGFATGWTYALSPIPFDWQGWRCGQDPKMRIASEKLRVLTTTAMQVEFIDVSGGGASGALAHIGVVKNLDTAFKKEATMTLQDDSGDEPVEIGVRGRQLFPRVRVVRSDIRFQLLTLTVSGKMHEDYLEDIT